MPNPRVCLIEDDKDLCAAAVRGLPGYDLHTFDDIPQIAALAGTHPQVVILDERLPSGSGVDFLPQIQKLPIQPAVIVVTAQATKDLVVRCLNRGVDHFLEKPFSLSDLQSALSALLKKNEELELGSETVLFRTRQCILENGTVMPLTPTEYRLVEKLVSQKGTCFSKTELTQFLWGDDVQKSGNTLDTHFCNLKKKSKIFAGKIHNLRSRGYYWKD